MGWRGRNHLSVEWGGERGGGGLLARIVRQRGSQEIGGEKKSESFFTEEAALRERKLQYQKGKATSRLPGGLVRFRQEGWGCLSVKKAKHNREEGRASRREMLKIHGWGKTSPRSV